MHNAVMCMLSLYDVIGLTRHLHIKLKSISNIAQPLHKEAVLGCSFLYIIVKKSVIMSEAFLVDVSIESEFPCLADEIAEPRPDMNIKEYRLYREQKVIFYRLSLYQLARDVLTWGHSVLTRHIFNRARCRFVANLQGKTG